MKAMSIALIMISLSAWAKQLHTSTVLETMNSGGYTYMKVQEGDKSYWIAATQLPIKKGDTISYAQEMKIHNFQSKTLKRTFKDIMFVSNVTGAKVPVGTKSTQPQPSAKAPTPHKELIQQTKDTISVEEAYHNAKTLAGKRIKIRGKVTKVLPMIMQRNWVHIQDGTGDSKTDDIVFTSQKSLPKVGDIVTAEGKVAVDKDFGYGYFYSVIMEESTFSK